MPFLYLLTLCLPPFSPPLHSLRQPFGRQRGSLRSQNLILTLQRVIAIKVVRGQNYFLVAQRLP